MRISLALAPVTVLVLLALGACGSPSPAPAPPAASSSPPKGELEAKPGRAAETTAPPVESGSSARKRTRSGPPSPGARDGTKPKNARPLNPHDAAGRTVFVRADDHCFVEVASKDPDAQATEVVDCPAEANDPAYDHCTAQIVLEPATSKCWCVTGRGNPRPMPNPTVCPTNAK